MDRACIEYQLNMDWTLVETWIHVHQAYTKHWLLKCKKLRKRKGSCKHTFLNKHLASWPMLLQGDSWWQIHLPHKPCYMRKGYFEDGFQKGFQCKTSWNDCTWRELEPNCRGKTKYHRPPSQTSRHLATQVWSSQIQFVRSELQISNPSCKCTWNGLCFRRLCMGADLSSISCWASCQTTQILAFSAQVSTTISHTPCVHPTCLQLLQCQRQSWRDLSWTWGQLDQCCLVQWLLLLLQGCHSVPWELSPSGSQDGVIPLQLLLQMFWAYFFE